MHQNLLKGDFPCYIKFSTILTLKSHCKFSKTFREQIPFCEEHGFEHGEWPLLHARCQAANSVTLRNQQRKQELKKNHPEFMRNREKSESIMFVVTAQPATPSISSTGLHAPSHRFTGQYSGKTDTQGRIQTKQLNVHMPVFNLEESTMSKQNKEPPCIAQINSIY